MKPKAVIIGAGGHAKVIADVLASGSEYEVIGCTDRSNSGKVLQLHVLGDDEQLPYLHLLGIRHAFVAIGDNRLRLKLAREVASQGFKFINAVSRFAYVSDSACLETGIAVMPGAVIQPEACVGSHSIINTGATVDHECIIGEGCHIAPGSNLAGNVKVGDGAFLGTGVKVIPGVRIGQGCVIGAGAVVIRDIPDYSVAVGVPARVVKQTEPGSQPT